MIKLTALAFSPLLAAMFCATMAPDLATQPVRPSVPTDRHFLAELEAQNRHALAQIATADRAFLAQLESDAPLPSVMPVVVAERVTHPTAPVKITVIPRATFVAPPRSAPATVAQRAPAALPVTELTPVRRAEAVNAAPQIASRRASILIYDWQVVTTRAAAMN